MNKQTIIIGLVLAFAAVCSAQTQPPPPTTCIDTRVSSGLNVCFDGKTGTFLGSHRFLRRDTVRVWICDFKPNTEYRVTVDEKVIPEPKIEEIIAVAQAPKPCEQFATILSDPFTARTDTLTLQIKEGTDSFNNGPGSPVTLTIGQPVFALALGFAGTPLGKTSYQTLGGSGSTGTSNGSSGSTIAYQENSASRVQPMGFLHASLYEARGWCCSAHLTAGFTITNNKISTNPEYLFGPSIGFLKEQLFITAGAYGGYRSALQGSYVVGGPAPSGSIPTVNQLHWKAGFAISWRVTSFGSSNNKSNTAGQTNPPTSNAKQK
jgi:hypothetical protein